MPNGLVRPLTAAASRIRGAPTSLMASCIVSAVPSPMPYPGRVTKRTRKRARRPGRMVSMGCERPWVMATIRSLTATRTVSSGFGQA